ncbi:MULTISPECIES: HesA/MoeB/ThiF family protein [Symbiopectobacterium]|uniref:HesA/MoeB/ThiF family protein n=1 Tax=Candidatus Symbiopectobacterium sp. PLON1 TaxID=2794575 RepID=UPI00207AB7F8|nr:MULTISPECIES: HesA/MoeB/ThiF family protein [Symbiopectobacterium]MBT9429174.1 HesA/MoeB/ThiF family protein [Candidatus Symbiopectobacterium endolongispinus]
MTHLNIDEKSYYLRHFSLPGFDENTQLKLKNSSVLVIGCGGLGVLCLLYLAGSGIGRIGIVDRDVISAGNLPRQVLFDYKDIGESKVKNACQRITALNPFIKIDGHQLFIREHNAREILRCYDIVVDCTDNFDTKYLLNDICEGLHKPLVYASIFQYEGQLAVFHYGNKFGYTISY